jgi:hypothetical protein
MAGEEAANVGLDACYCPLAAPALEHDGEDLTGRPRLCEAAPPQAGQPHSSTSDFTTAR